VTAWDSVNEHEQTQTKLIERLIKEEARLAAMDDAITTAMVAKQKRNKGNQHRTTDSKSSVDENNLDMKKNVVCYFCKKCGYISRYCLKKKMRPEVI